MDRKKFRELLSLTRVTIKDLSDVESSPEKSDLERSRQRIFNQLIELIKMELSDCRLEYLSSRNETAISQKDEMDSAGAISADPEGDENPFPVKSSSELDKPLKYVAKPIAAAINKPRKAIRDFIDEESLAKVTSSYISLPKIKLAAAVLLGMLSLAGLYFIGLSLWPTVEDKSIDVSRLNLSRPGKIDIAPTLNKKSVITESQLIDLTDQELAKGNLKAAREYLRLVVTRNPTNRAARERLKELNDKILELEKLN